MAKLMTEFPGELRWIGWTALVNEVSLIVLECGCFELRWRWTWSRLGAVLGAFGRLIQATAPQCAGTYESVFFILLICKIQRLVWIRGPVGPRTRLQTWLMTLLIHILMDCTGCLFGKSPCWLGWLTAVTNSYLCGRQMMILMEIRYSTKHWCNIIMLFHGKTTTCDDATVAVCICNTLNTLGNRISGRISQINCSENFIHRLNKAILYWAIYVYSNSASMHLMAMIWLLIPINMLKVLWFHWRFTDNLGLWQWRRSIAMM